jgi:hypothetical protein
VVLRVRAAAEFAPGLQTSAQTVRIVEITTVNGFVLKGIW